MNIHGLGDVVHLCTSANTKESHHATQTDNGNR